MGELKAKNLKLTSDLKEFKSYVAAQDQEIQQLKNKFSQLEFSKLASYEVDETDAKHSNKRDEGSKPRLNVSPKSCVELTSHGNTKLDGTFLVKDDTTNKIKAIFCRFGNNEPENSKNYFISIAMLKLKSHVLIDYLFNFNVNIGIEPAV